MGGLPKLAVEGWSKGVTHAVYVSPFPLISTVILFVKKSRRFLFIFSSGFWCRHHHNATPCVPSANNAIWSARWQGRFHVFRWRWRAWGFFSGSGRRSCSHELQIAPVKEHLMQNKEVPTYFRGCGEELGELKSKFYAHRHRIRQVDRGPGCGSAAGTQQLWSWKIWSTPVLDSSK